MSDAFFGHRFNMIEEMHPTALRRIYEFFGGFKVAWEKGDAAAFELAGVSGRLVSRILEVQKNSGALEAAVEGAARMLGQEGITVLVRKDETFPSSLCHIPNPPVLLYQKGALLQPQKILIAIVGTRFPSPYGESVATDVAAAVSLAGGITVSGLAFGIDSAVHTTAVHLGCPTVAVLAGSLLAGNGTMMGTSSLAQHELAEKILANGGTLFSEYATSIAYKGQFLERNRLISGLSRATVVVEAKERSGALSTARHALEQNRTVYAVPGDIDRPQAQGTLQLLVDGDARMFTSNELFLEDVGLASGTFGRGEKGKSAEEGGGDGGGSGVGASGDGSGGVDGGGVEAALPVAEAPEIAQHLLVLFSLLQEPLLFDDIVVKSGYPAARVGTLLTLLETKKLAAKQRDGRWKRVM